MTASRLHPLCCVAMCSLLACGGAQTTLPAGATGAGEREAEAGAHATPPETLPGTLHGTLTRDDFADNPELLERLRESLYGYFRFTNHGFSDLVCTRFADVMSTLPTVNLHGDAHLEQYAVTSMGRGLADYDDATAGPPVLDLVRFGASVQLAAELKGWDDAPALDAFFSGYRAALAEPDVEREIPAFVNRCEANFRDERLRYLEWVESLMEPGTAAQDALFERSFARYQELMREEHPELPMHFFAPKRHGRLRMGFGSAMAMKFLVRVEGPTLAEEDDVVLEAKELSDLSAVRCVRHGASAGAFRVLVGQARIAERPRPYFATVPAGPEGDPRFWIHSWVDNYRELEIAEDLPDPAELLRIAFDVGAQLGRGHTRQIAAPYDFQLRRAVRQMLDTQEPRLRSAVNEMVEATREGWARFREETTPR